MHWCQIGRSGCVAVLALASAGAGAQTAAVPGPLGAKAASAPASAAAPQDARRVVVALRDVTVVAKLCRTVRDPGGLMAAPPNVLGGAAAAGELGRKQALEHVYQVEMNGTQVQFEQHDVTPGTVAVSTLRGFYLMDGALGLWSTESGPLEFRADDAAVRQLVAARKAGSLRLRLWFHLDADPDPDDSPDPLDVSPCATRPHTGAYQLAVQWLAAELFDEATGKKLAHHLGEHGRETQVVAQMFLGAPRLKVGVPEGASDKAGVVQQWVEARVGALDACHSRHASGGEGGVVLGLQTNAQGALSQATVDVSSLEGDDVNGCMLHVLEGGPALHASSSTHITVPLVWFRD